MDNRSQTVAFLGLGNMGGPMAANLVGAGLDVRGFDPVAAAQDAARTAGITVCDSPAEAVRGAGVVITMLPNGALVTSTYDDVLGEAGEGTLFIDSSTISVDDAREVHRVKGATAGTLAFMVGGEDEAFAAAQPVLEPMAGKVIHCGGAGAGQAAKVCNNMVLAVHQIAIAEAFVLAEGLGLDHQALFDVVTGATGNSWALHTNCPVPGPVPTSPANNDFTPGFAAALMNKDLGLALAALESTGTVAPLGAAAAALYDEFAQDNGGKDFSAIITSIRDSSRS